MASSVFMLNAAPSLMSRLRSSTHRSTKRATSGKKISHGDEAKPQVTVPGPQRSETLAPPTLQPGNVQSRVVLDSPPSKQALPPQSQWSLLSSTSGSKQCFIVGLVVNLLAFEYVAPENVVWKLLLCTMHCVAVSIVFYTSSPSTKQNHTGIHNLDVTSCTDPGNCCLHKPAEVSTKKTSRAQDTKSFEVQPRTPIGSVKRFPLGISMAKSEMNPSGNTSGTPHSCSFAHGETFQIRGPDYKKSKKKEASKAALFEFIGADLLRADSKIDLISQRLELPEEFANDKVFIINAQLPSYGPSVWGDAVCDGPGFTLALCWRIPPDVCEELKDPKSKELRLFKRFVEAGNDASLTDRFKVIAQVTNQDQCGLTGMAKKLLVSHNSTPVLTRPQHRIYHFNEGSTEIVVDIHAFSYIARRGIHMLLDKCANLVIDVAFVLQGETEDELPERILGCCRLDSLDITKAMELP